MNSSFGAFVHTSGAPKLMPHLIPPLFFLDDQKMILKSFVMLLPMIFIRWSLVHNSSNVAMCCSINFTRDENALEGVSDMMRMQS